jgi:peptidoglycan-N-acetylmuramic acid deacetylase
MGGQNMKQYIFKIMALCLCIFAFTPTISCYAAEYYWYCKRNREHKQPVCDSNFDFIEQYGGIYVDKNHGDESEEKVIYLTFDVGYENGNVAKIMDVMKEEGVKGTFFILGNVIDREAELVKRMINEGHVVANHTLTHKNLAGKSESAFLEEIEGLEKKYKELTGKEISKFFRPPEGTFDQKMLEYANKKGYKTVFWSFAYADWDNNSQMSEKVALKKILDNVHNGEIMLLHPTSATNAKIMKNLIKELKSMGYCFATLEELE